jgi:hypothetical protein
MLFLCYGFANVYPLIVLVSFNQKVVKYNLKCIRLKNSFYKISECKLTTPIDMLLMHTFIKNCGCVLALAKPLSYIVTKKINYFELIFYNKFMKLFNIVRVKFVFLKMMKTKIH